MATIQVAIVEDQQAERNKLARLLERSSGFACAAVCASAEEAFEKIPPKQPDVVLMDIKLPGVSGIDCLRRLKSAAPKIQVMMLTVFEDHEAIFQSLAAGATGYLLKSTPASKLLEAIRELHAGGAPMSGQIARLVVASFNHAAAAAAKLSPIEHRVLALLARGFLYKEVAEDLKLSLGTVRTHVWHIYDKLQVNNRTEAILKTFPRRG